MAKFLSTPSARRATRSPWPPPPGTAHFYPRPPRGGRQAGTSPPPNFSQFLSTPSARRATAECRLDDGIIYISIHALCEEGDHGVDGAKRHRNISIHALCEEGDSTLSTEFDRKSYFYPRPLRGGRLWSSANVCGISVFLSTPSARRATRLRLVLPSWFCDFYPRPLRGGRLSSVLFRLARGYFYPRPLRGGRPGFVPFYR